MELTVAIDDADQRAVVFGPSDRNLRMIRAAFGVQLAARDASIRIAGPPDNVGRAGRAIEILRERVRTQGHLLDNDVSAALAEAQRPPTAAGSAGGIDVLAGNLTIQPKTEGQQRYIDAILNHDLTICVGPAGTGKTYLAVALGISLLKHNRIKRIVLVRPAVEAGEKLGYLPGDMQAKVNPYLRPLFDAMNDMMSFDQVRRFMQNDVIEVIPLAFMRGRTLNHAVIILDEAQNTTVRQMLMFLTRLGERSRMIVTGDDSQVDLDAGQVSGMADACRRLRAVEGVGIVRLGEMDIVRHPLVQRVVEAYGNGSR